MCRCVGEPSKPDKVQPHGRRHEVESGSQRELNVHALAALLLGLAHQQRAERKGARRDQVDEDDV
eukprot:419617-Prymnesium_polylepis.3